MDRFGYKRILEEVMNPPLRTLEAELPDVNWTFQQDNDPKHKSRVVSEWFEKNGIITLPWPAQSPDLNLIENLWAEVGRRRKRSFTRPEELLAAVRTAWESIPVQRLQGLVESMPSRCKAVIEARGHATKLECNSVVICYDFMKSNFIRY
ncbi:unnamed protein product [Cylicocyclus nassatus]|uniref:Tc1-like transposase DDE domain-containing protein n=1 Tax=Cylicocyclus nassatus TaxID=53992 RepID=A0AA36GK81_CYLNA|nr:unnamed protein product [Cylicocyclus nassatus]